MLQAKGAAPLGSRYIPFMHVTSYYPHKQIDKINKKETLNVGRKTVMDASNRGLTTFG